MGGRGVEVGSIGVGVAVGGGGVGGIAVGVGTTFITLVLPFSKLFFPLKVMVADGLLLTAGLFVIV